MFPQVFLDFCQREDIDPSLYTSDPPYRYFTGHDLSEEIEAEQVPWLPEFYRVPSSTNISQLPAYKAGHLLAMDVSSGLAVSLLEVENGQDVLDLCCAPGMKLALLARQAAAAVSVTGVDISAPRLAAARAIAKRYRLPRARLFLADGTCCSIPRHVLLPRESRLAPASTNSFWSSSVYRKSPGVLADAFYDRVLVDAQCTHDGSIRHLRKLPRDSPEWSQFEVSHLEALYELQLGLLRNGWRHLKPGGILIYSTCSLSRRQNEGIIEKFMAETEGAIPHPFTVAGLCQDTHVLRLHPEIHQTGGFFIARFRKNC